MSAVAQMRVLIKILTVVLLVRPKIFIIGVSSRILNIGAIPIPIIGNRRKKFNTPSHYETGKFFKAVDSNNERTSWLSKE
ncbi:hypothetical protein D3C87_1519780 [compost metagenome]